MRTHQRFEKWIKGTGWSDMEAGFHIGCDRAYVGRIASGSYTPGLRIAAAIERLTASLPEGPIRCVDWERDRIEVAAKPTSKPKQRRRKAA